MAISKQFQPHTELKAEDLNELIAQTNAYIVQEGNKKPSKVDVSELMTEGSELPLADYYTYGGRPVEAFTGVYAATDEGYIAICNYHYDVYFSIILYVKNEQNKYIFRSHFYSHQASTPIEQYVSDIFTGIPVTHTQNGVMTKEDKVTFDEMVTEVFPLTVGVVSSNAGIRETGDEVSPHIVLSITRKGVDVPANEIVQSISPTPIFVSDDKRTIMGNSLTSGTTIYQIAVTQGGQTKSVANQVFDFMNYRYYGVINSSTEPTKAQVKTLCENGTLTKQLSRSTKMSATDLAANKCYVFVVPNTNVNLIVRNAKSGNPISGCTVDTVTISRVNGTDAVSCKYVIVPAGSAAWTFEITNQ